jgi:two-component system, NtrC family, sensor kinase
MAKILLIDDMQENIEYLSDIMRIYLPGIDIISENSGEEGVTAAHKERPDLVIVDLFMPKIDGCRVCENLRADETMNTIPIIVISAGTTNPEKRIKALEAGADLFISKPVDASEFIAQVKALMRVKQMEDKLREEKLLLETRVEEKTRALQERLEEYERSERLLKQTQEKLNISQEVAKIGYWEYDYVSKKNTWSDNQFRLMGLKKGEVNPDHNQFIKRVHPDDVHLIEKYEKILLKERRPVEFELRYIQPDKTVYILNKAIPLIENGELRKVYGVNMDITERIRSRIELNKRTRQLTERIKELNCLYAISELKERPGITLEKIIEGTVKLIPPAWQYPKATCARIIMDGREYKTPNFRDTKWKQVCEIRVDDLNTGLLEVCLLEEKPEKDEGPFLLDERRLLNTVAERLGRAAKRNIMESALRVSEERFRSVVETASDAIVSLNREGNVIFWNKAAEKIFGYSKKEILGKPLTTIIPLQFRGVHNVGMKRVLTTGEEKFLGQTINTTAALKSGKEIPVELSVARWEGRKDIYFTGIIRDISQRRAIEKKISESEKKYRSLFEESKDAVFFTTIEGRLKDINPAGVELFGYSSIDEIKRVDIVKNLYYHKNDRKRFQSVIRDTGYVKEFEVNMKKKDGSLITVLLTAQVEKDKNGNITGYRGIIRDISARVRNEQKLKQMNAELLEANNKLKQAQASLFQQGKLAAIGQLAAGVAHEINNPLGFVASNFSTLEKYFNSIQSFYTLFNKTMSEITESHGQFSKESIELLMEEKQKMGIEFIMDDVYDIFTESQEGLERIRNIVENLRSFSRVDYENKIEKYNINAAIENTLTVAKNEVKYVAEVETDFSDIPLIECRGDEINQVLLNIIVNAAQAIKNQERQDIGKIRIRTYKNETHVGCDISDTGPGIPEDIIDKIFDPFFTTKDVGEGTGLGLNICHDIVVNKHNGELTVASEKGKGSTFSIRLPIDFSYKSQDAKNGNGDESKGSQKKTELEEVS